MKEPFSSMRKISPKKPEFILAQDSGETTESMRHLQIVKIILVSLSEIKNQLKASILT